MKQHVVLKHANILDNQSWKVYIPSIYRSQLSKKLKIPISPKLFRLRSSQFNKKSAFKIEKQKQQQSKKQYSEENTETYEKLLKKIQYSTRTRQKLLLQKAIKAKKLFKKYQTQQEKNFNNENYTYRSKKMQQIDGSIQIAKKMNIIHRYHSNSLKGHSCLLPRVSINTPISKYISKKVKSQNQQQQKQKYVVKYESKKKKSFQQIKKQYITPIIQILKPTQQQIERQKSQTELTNRIKKQKSAQKYKNIKHFKILKRQSKSNNRINLLANGSINGWMNTNPQEQEQIY